MSAAGNVEQKQKPPRSQAQNGPVNPKEVSSEATFERYMPSNQVTQGYPAAQPNMAPADTTTYMASYYPSTYSFPYSMPGSETTWSTGGDNFNSQNYGYDFSYPTQDYYNQPGTTPPYLGQSFNFFPGNDFTPGSWSGPATAPQGQAGTPAAPSSYYDYARYPGAQAPAANIPRQYQSVNGYEVQPDGKAHGMKAVEQGMSVLNIGPSVDKGGMGGPPVVNGSNGKADARAGGQGGAPSFSQAAAGGGGAPSGGGGGGGKPTSWAAIASKPAKLQLSKAKSKTGLHAPVPTQLPSMKQPMTIGTWNAGDKPGGKMDAQGQPPPQAVAPTSNETYASQGAPAQKAPPVQAVPPQPVVKSESGPTPQQASQITQGKQNFSNSEQSGRSQPQAVVQPQPQQQSRWGSSSQHHGSRSSNSSSNYSSRSNNTRNSGGSSSGSGSGGGGGGGNYSTSSSSSSSTSVVLDKLRSSNEYNPSELTLDTKNARFFIIKSYSEDDIHRSIKYGIWCSTEHGNKRLDSAFRDKKSGGCIYLLYSVNGSGHFCGIAEMNSPVDYATNTGVWAQDKWKGRFDVKWIYVKDVPNSQLRHIRLENNENKPVTNSRDTQEVPVDKARQVIKIIHGYRHTTSIFDDFSHYEKRQEEDSQRKVRPTRGGHRN